MLPVISMKRNENLKNIPNEMTGYTAIDENTDDEFMFCLSKQVSMLEMYLKCTLVTGEVVSHISKIRQLKELTLREHKK